ncbi:MAG: ferrochelatase [Bacteroidetes bacterium]|nr:ferrochelatase [Bacteroidota bacterium]
MLNETTGLIILNLGSPDSPGRGDVNRYLRQFLMDERVIDAPALIRTILVKGYIVPMRAGNSAEAYRSIWTKEGSPLKVISEKFTNLVTDRLEMPVTLGMRYGAPSTAYALQKLLEKAPAIKTILVAPMYPHYAMSSYETAIEHLKDAVRAQGVEAQIKVLKPFYNDPLYIEALAASIRPYLERGEYDGYLFSYHGLPVRHLKKSDPTKKHCYITGDCCDVASDAWQTCYKHQVKITTKLVTEKLGMEPNKIHLTFQSRLAGDKWLQPYTDTALQELPKNGTKKLLALCPAFVADCLETLEEMDMRGREEFMSNGGEVYDRVPCLNTDAAWVDAFATWCAQHEGAYASLWK